MSSSMKPYFQIIDGTRISIRHEKHQNVNVATNGTIMRIFLLTQTWKRICMKTIRHANHRSVENGIAINYYWLSQGKP